MDGEEKTGEQKLINDVILCAVAKKFGHDPEKMMEKACEAEKIIQHAARTLPVDKALDVAAWAVMSIIPVQLTRARVAAMLVGDHKCDPSCGPQALALPVQILKRDDIDEFQNLNNGEDVYNVLIDQALIKCGDKEEFPATAIFITKDEVRFLDVSRFFNLGEFPPEAGKDIAASLLKSIAQSHGQDLQGLCFVSEVWYSKPSLSQTSQLVPPSEDPHRREALMFNLEWTGQEPIMKIRPFTRTSDGAILFEEAESTQGDTHTGRFNNLMQQDLTNLGSGG